MIQVEVLGFEKLTTPFLYAMFDLMKTSSPVFILLFSLVLFTNLHAQSSLDQWMQDGQRWFQHQHQRQLPTQIIEDIRTILEREGPQAAQELMTTAKLIQQTFSDQSTWQRAWRAALVASRSYSELKNSQQQWTYETLHYAMQTIRVYDSRGRKVSLEQFSTEWIHQNAPYLSETSIGRNPTKAFTYGLVFGNLDYISNDLKVIKSPSGEYLSLVDAIYRQSGINQSNGARLIRVFGNTQILTNNQLDLDDLLALTQLIEDLQAEQGVAATRY